MKTLSPRAGDVLRGKYRVIRVLGEGGMGVVVRATHLRLDRDVAIKMLRGDASERPRLVARFAREARAAAKLRGEHAVRILDVDDGDEGAPFIVMEYLEGRDLDRVVRKEGPLDVARAVGYALEACEGLAEAHALGIVHRDVKPANLFVAALPRGGEIVKLLDFGISKPASGDDPTLTEGDRILGSPSFMSPEQLKTARDVDARTDVWSMGVVLHFLVSGKLPFPGESATEVAAKIASDAPLPLDSPIAAIVARCLEKDRDARFATVAELAHALAPFAPAGEGDEAARRVASMLRLPAAPAIAAAPSSADPSGELAAGASSAQVAAASRQTASLGELEAAAPVDRVTASVDAPLPTTSTSPGEAKIKTEPPPPPARRRWAIAVVVAGAAAAIAALVASLQRDGTHASAPTTTSPTTSAVAPPTPASVTAPSATRENVAPAAASSTPSVSAAAPPRPAAKPAAPRASATIDASRPDDALKLDLK